jgi:integrase
MRKDGSAGPKRKKAIPGEQYLVRREGSQDWHFDITIRGRRLRRSCRTAEKDKAAAVAQQAYDELWAVVVEGKRQVERLTLPQAFARYYDEVARGTAYGEQAQKHQMATIIEILGPHVTLDQLDDAMVNGLVQALRRRHVIPHNAPEGSTAERRRFSGATINRYITTLSAMCTRARKVWKLDVGEWDRSLHMQEESQGREVFLEVDQARALVDAVIPHARPILILALATGLRKANVHGLAWENVSLDMGRIVMMTKRDKPHAVPLPEPLVDMLAQIEPDPAARRGPVFRFGNPNVPCNCSACLSPAKRGHPITSTRRAFETAARACGLADMPNGRLRFHDLRHTVASWALASGGDLRVVQEQLGHQNIQTTARYAHLVAGRREAVIGAATAGLLNPPCSAKAEGKKA